MAQVNKQITLKPQDLVVLLKLVSLRGRVFTYAGVAQALYLVPSAVHSSLRRAELARLVSTSSQRPVVNRKALLEFTLSQPVAVKPSN